MLMLRFRVANHRSIQGEVELSLVSSRLRRAAPIDGDWAAATTRVAGIFGANASGKSTVLHALEFFRTATRNSATHWSERESFPYQPFLLDDTHPGEPSLYELDFVTDGVRYTFGFRSTAAGILDEWLHSYPSGRRRVLYERHGDDYEFGRSLPGENVRMSKAVQATALFLSYAANGRHPVLSRIHHMLVRHIKIARFAESDRAQRLGWVMRVIEDEKARGVAESLLQLADVGISRIGVEEQPVPESMRKLIAAMARSLDAEDSGRPQQAEEFTFMREGTHKVLRFHHGASGSADELPTLGVDDESNGTLTWLALALPALDALRRGEVFVVDELDCSLHPMLAMTLIGFFKDSTVNDRGAQLIFTSHDTSLLGSLHDTSLAPEEVWFTEKSAEGSTGLFSLAEFKVRDRDNFERRYLQGRYGAVPVIAHGDMRRIVDLQAE